HSRGTAMGIVNAGASVGATVAPPLIASSLLLTGWRWSFVLIGSIGILWTIVWRRYSALAPAEVTSPTDPAPHTPWIGLFALRPIWTLFVCRFLYDFVFYFCLFWLPKYLIDARGFDIRSVGLYAW